LGTFLQQIINGLALGSIYALIALGYTMVYGVLKLINFAHGDVFMIGAYAGLFVATAVGTAAGPLTVPVVFLGSMAICALIGVLMERFGYRPLLEQSRMSILITAIGISLLFENLGILLFGATPRTFPAIIPERVFEPLSDVFVRSSQLAVFGVSVVLMLLLRWVVFGTRMGLAMRAVSHSIDAAKLMGVPTNRTIGFTFALGSALAAAGGILFALVFPKIEPLMGVMAGLKAFVAAVLGGIGSIPGSLIGGLVIGLAETMIVGYGDIIHVESTYRDAVAFLILIFVLLVRPQGILGRIEKEKV
jgi:branched-chain amino acid transport system permease protein